MGTYTSVQSVCFNIIDRPRKNWTQASQNSSVTQNCVFITENRNLFQARRKVDQKNFLGTPNTFSLVLLVET